MSDKYICILRDQPACDYSIGCGVAIVPAEGDSEEEAWEQVLAYMDWNDTERLPDKLIEVRLVKIVSDNHTIYEDWYENRRAENARMQEAERQQQDEKLLADLAAKLGKKVT